MKENKAIVPEIWNANFEPKDVQRILSSRKSIMNRKCSTRKLFLKISHIHRKALVLESGPGV